MNILLIIIVACYVTPTIAGWYDCKPCRCYQSSQNVIAQCARTNSQFDPTLNSIPKCLNKDIQELHVRGQPITILYENDFDYFHNLEILDLSKNSIRIVQNHAFRNLTKLRELYLSRNELITLPTNIFQDTPRLTSIYLSNNKFATLQKDLFSNLLFLKEVHMQNNSLLTIQEKCFGNVPLLTTINFSHNQLSYISPEAFSNINNMKKVNLADNPWNCDRHLCEIMNITITHSWDKLSSPVCYHPENKYGRTWRDVLNNYTPTIAFSVSKCPTEQNTTFRCDICSVSGIIWYHEHQNINEKVVEVTEKYSTTAMLTLNVSEGNTNNNGAYYCQIKNCITCEEDAIFLTVNKSSLELTKQKKNSRPIAAALKGDKVLEENITTTTNIPVIESTTTSSTHRSKEITMTQVSEQILTSTTYSQYVDKRNNVDVESKEGSKLIYLVVISAILFIVLLIFFLVYLRMLKNKYRTLKKQVQKESEPLRNGGPESSRIIQREESMNNTMMNIPIADSINTNYFEETTHTENNNILNNSSAEYTINTSENLDISTQMSRHTSIEFLHLLVNSGLTNEYNHEYLILRPGLSYYNDEITD